MELEVEVFRHKRDWCVFGSPDLVSRELRERVTNFVSRRCRQWSVEVYVSPAPLHRYIYLWAAALGPIYLSALVFVARASFVM